MYWNLIWCLWLPHIMVYRFAYTYSEVLKKTREVGVGHMQFYADINRLN